MEQRTLYPADGALTEDKGDGAGDSAGVAVACPISRFLVWISDPGQPSLTPLRGT